MKDMVAILKGQLDGGGEKKGIEGIVVGMNGIEGNVIGMVGSEIHEKGGNVAIGIEGMFGNVGIGKDGIWVLGKGSNVGFGKVVGAVGKGVFGIANNGGIVGSEEVCNRLQATWLVLMLESDNAKIKDTTKLSFKIAIVNNNLMGKL